MVNVISVRFKRVGKAYYFDPGELEIPKGAQVVVETSYGLEMGTCIMPKHEVDDERIVSPLRKVLRLATPEDETVVSQNAEKEKRAIEICVRKIDEHKLDMKFVDVEYTFDGSKIIFYFTADGRVDFRELVKDLAGVFRMRIELRQIGVRDEAKMLGGLGICGKPFCCSTFLDEFQPVSIKMAKEQNLSLNPVKISGTCGRLMCCLKYEQEAYEDLLRTTPRVDAQVKTPEGIGTVTDVNLLRGNLKVRLDDAPDSIKCFHKCDVCMLKNGAQRSKKRPSANRDNGSGNGNGNGTGNGHAADSAADNVAANAKVAAGAKPAGSEKPMGNGNAAGNGKAPANGNAAGGGKPTGNGKPAGSGNAAASGKAPANGNAAAGSGKTAGSGKPGGGGKPAGGGAAANGKPTGNGKPASRGSGRGAARPAGAPKPPPAPSETAVAVSRETE